MHWHLDDPKTILDPRIITMATEINLGKDEGIIWDRLGPPESIVDNFEFDIFDRSRTALSGTVGDGSTGWTDDSTTTSLKMNEAAVKVLTKGSVMLVNDTEMVIVKSVDRDSNLIDVIERGAGGTTASSHADGTSFKVIGGAINNNDLKDVESMFELSGKYTNYCQRFPETIDREFDDIIQARKAFEQEPQIIREALDRMFRKLAASCILGRKQKKTKSKPYMTAGILQQLAEGGDERSPLRLNASGITDPETLMKTALKTVWAAGGNPRQCYISPANKYKFGPLMDGHVRLSRSEAKVIGTESPEAFLFDNVEVEFVADKDMPDDRIEIVTEEMINKGWRKDDILRGPVEEPSNSSLEKRFAIYGSAFIMVKGVGVNHIDVHNVNI